VSLRFFWNIKGFSLRLGTPPEITIQTKNISTLIPAI